MKLQPTAVMTGVIMPGGYHYEENGKKIVEDAISYEDLIERLAKYRAANGLPLGDPQRDVDRYICTNYPNMCGGQMPTPVDDGTDPIELCYGQPVKRTPRERVMQWAANRMQKVGQIELVDRDEANRRATVCAMCPMKRRWNEPVEGCPGCNAYVEEAEVNLFKIRRAKHTDLQIGGHMCDVAGHDLETASFLEEPALRHRRNYAGLLPSNCWMNEL